VARGVDDEVVAALAPDFGGGLAHLGEQAAGGGDEAASFSVPEFAAMVRRSSSKPFMASRVRENSRKARPTSTPAMRVFV
jgi:hypothetical protein